MIIVSEKYVCKYLSETNCIEYNANFNITIHYFTVISSVFQSYVADSFCVRHNMVKEIAQPRLWWQQCRLASEERII